MQNSKSRVVDIEQTNSDAVNEKDIVLQTVPQKPAKRQNRFAVLQTASPKHCLSDILYAILQNHATPTKI